MNEPSGGCLRHAFDIGLAYMGRQEDLSWIPNKASMEDVRKAATRFGLTVIDSFGGFVLPEFTPVLVVYVTGLQYGGEYDVYHAVFASDILAFKHLQIVSTVIGWNGKHEYADVEKAEEAAYA
jgi:hypothetical protein